MVTRDFRETTGSQKAQDELGTFCPDRNYGSTQLWGRQKDAKARVKGTPLFKSMIIVAFK